MLISTCSMLVSAIPMPCFGYPDATFDCLCSDAKYHPIRRCLQFPQDGEQTMLANEVDFPSWNFNNNDSSTGVGSDSVGSVVRNEQTLLPETQTLVSVTWPIGNNDAGLAEEKSSVSSDAVERDESVVRL